MKNNLKNKKNLQTFEEIREFYDQEQKRDEIEDRIMTLIDEGLIKVVINDNKLIISDKNHNSLII